MEDKKPLPKYAQCFSFFDVNPNPSKADKEKIAESVGCKLTTVYSALKRWRKVKKDELERLEKERQEKLTAGAKRHAQKQANTLQVPRIKRNSGFIKFANLFSYPYYKQLYRWQIQWFKECLEV